MQTYTNIRGSEKCELLHKNTQEVGSGTQDLARVVQMYMNSQMPQQYMRWVLAHRILRLVQTHIVSIGGDDEIVLMHRSTSRRDSSTTYKCHGIPHLVTIMTLCHMLCHSHPVPVLSWKTVSLLTDLQHIMTRHDTHGAETHPTLLTQPPLVLKQLPTTVDTPTSMLQSQCQHTANTAIGDMLHPLDTHQSWYCTADAVPSYYATMPDAASPFCALHLMWPFTYMVNPLLYILLTFYPWTFTLTLMQWRCPIFLPFVL